LIAGAIIFTISIFSMIFTENFYILFLIRALAGLGQGMVFSGIQSYILDNSSSKEKTKGTAIIVYGYNAGMLSGTAIGGLLVKSIHPEGVFGIYFLISLFLICYIYLFIQDTKISSDKPKNYIGFFDIFKNMKYVIKDLKFIKGIIFVGIPTKIVLGGVMIFSMPLLLNKAGYVNDDIGQMLIFYSLGVLGSSIFSSRLADKSQNAKFVLQIGTFMSAIGLILMGSSGSFEGDFFKTISIISGILILGIAHGFIHAPIVSYITEAKCTDKIGVFTTVAIYRFVERMGHAMGPIVLSSVLIFSNQNMVAIQFTGVVILIFGLLFSLKDR
jgi:predicted MFS family arabinose efflux permease